LRTVKINRTKELEDLKAKLIDHRQKVQTALDDIDRSSDQAWDDIQQGAKNTWSEIKVECERLNEKLDVALKNS
jgi:hypothetical protein